MIELKKDYMALHEAKADPHTQYLLVDGSRDGTGANQDFDGNISSVDMNASGNVFADTNIDLLKFIAMG